jgi:hypothetical protein
MSQAWKIQREWEGDTCAVLASGPSMSQEIAERIRGMRTIVVNDNYKLAPWADVLYAADYLWWKEHPEALKFAGRRVTIMPIGCSTIEFPELRYLENGGYGGLDPRPTHIRTGKNSGYQAIHIAAHLGVRKILLCGFDMREVKGKKHWFGEHPPSINKTQPFNVWISLFNVLAPMLRAKGIEVINCTPESALRCFKEESLEKALESVLHDKRHAALSA